MQYKFMASEVGDPITGCVSNWVNAGQCINNGVLQMQASQACNPTYYYPDFLMTDTLCITSNFSYEIRLRNLNPTPLNLSAYDVYLKILNTSGITTGVTLMDANPNYDWSQIYTSLYAGASSVGNVPRCNIPAIYVLSRA